MGGQWWFESRASNRDMLEGWLATCQYMHTVERNRPLHGIEWVRRDCVETARNSLNRWINWLGDGGWDVNNLYVEMNKERICVNSA